MSSCDMCGARNEVECVCNRDGFFEKSTQSERSARIEKTAMAAVEAMLSTSYAQDMNEDEIVERAFEIAAQFAHEMEKRK